MIVWSAIGYLVAGLIMAEFHNWLADSKRLRGDGTHQAVKYLLLVLLWPLTFSIYFFCALANIIVTLTRIGK
jgi:hypothetical protein